MGPEHLILALALALVGCGGHAREPGPAAPTAGSRHMQVVRAMSSPQRLELVTKFRDRNGADWAVNDAALFSSVTVVDPFVGFLRRAHRRPADASQSLPLDRDAVLAKAREFVRKNADLLGVPNALVLTLDEEADPEVDHWVARFQAKYPSKGYESFKELDNQIDVHLSLDAAGTVTALENLSKIHAHLTIDTKPLLGEDDPRLYAKLVGRRVFALEDGVKIELGTVSKDDFISSKVFIEESPGPFLAWVTYRLSRIVTASKPALDGLPSFYFFGWVVDADSGDVTHDSPVPTTSMPVFP